MKTRYFISILFLALCTIGWSQAPSLTMTVDRNPVSVSDRFRLTIKLEGAKGDLIVPTLKDFNIVGGPSVSTQMSWINGTMSNSTSHTYFLSAKATGTFTIPSAKAQTSNGTLESQPLEMTVFEGQAGSQASSGPATSKAAVSSSDECFVRILTDKRKAVKGEPITVSYVLYNRYQGFELQEYEFPQLSGFWKEEIKLNNIQWETRYEEIDGRNYQKAYFAKQVLIPQRTGTLEIGPFEIEANVGRSFFRQGTPIRVKSNILNIEVAALPSAPAAFTGGVGSLDFEMDIDRTEVKANEAINLTLTVSGKGNIPLVEAPELTFPKDFEVYDPKVTDKSVRNAAGISGSKVFEYLIIPRYAGTYELDAIAFSYYDPKTERFETEMSAPIIITVEKDSDEGGSNGPRITRKEEVSSIGNDIRHIKKEVDDLMLRGEQFVGSFGHMAGLLSPFLLLAGFVLVRRRQEKLDADPMASRQRSAAKTAARYLKEAKKNLQAGHEKEFYITLYQAMNDYISHKYQIPMALMTKEKIHEELDAAGVDRGTVGGWQRALADCEMARYAPTSGASPEALFEQVESLIALIERKA